MDPENVLIRCPNGHQLQAAPSDVGKMLCCPVCNTTFATGGPPAGATVPDGAAPPTQIDYAGYPARPVSQPVTRPQYIGFLAGLWIAIEIVSTINTFATVLSKTDSTKLQPFDMLVACFTVLLVIPAIVLQLMWIYRIHDDALKCRGYPAVSPGMALGLSFIPLFNVCWTGWTMKKLAEFAASRAMPQDAKALEVVRAATICFYFGIVRGLVTCIGGAAGGLVGFQSAMRAGGQAPVNPFATAGPGFYFVIIMVTLVSLASVLVYAWALRKLHAFVYDFLGAPA